VENRGTTRVDVVGNWSERVQLVRAGCHDIVIFHDRTPTDCTSSMVVVPAV